MKVWQHPFKTGPFRGPQKLLNINVFVCWKNEHRFPYLKAAARELLGTTATSAPSEQVFSHASELYSAKRANLGIRIFAILMLMKMNPHVGMN